MEKPKAERKATGRTGKDNGMDRVKTGISGLDEMLNGGIPARKHVAVNGGPGTGKTSLCFEFLYRGAKNGENGIYVSFEESPEDIIANMSGTFPGLDDVEALIKEGKLEIIKPEKLELEDVTEMLQKKVSSHGVRRIAIDSATMIKMSFKSDIEYRRALFDFVMFLKKLNLTSMMVVECNTAKKERMKYSLEHFILDGIINLYTLSMEEKNVRSLEILKMRGTDHSRDLVPFKVEEDGTKIYVGEKVF